MSNRMSKSVNSHLSRGVMTTHNTPLTHFQRDLEERSIGAPGRALLRVLNEKGLNPAEAGCLIDLGHWLQSPGHVADETLVRINRLASLRREFVSLVVVALRTELESYLARAAKHQSGAFLLSNFSTGVLVAIDDLAKYPVWWRREDFLLQIKRSTRRAEREMIPTFKTESLPHENVLPPLAGEEIPDDTRWNALGLALSLRLISWTDFALVEFTHNGEVSLADAAKTLGVSYDTLNKRRQRTEQKVRELIDTGLVL